MARPKNPNSQRSLLEKRREAEQKAKLEAERAAAVEAELKAELQAREEKAKALEEKTKSLELRIEEMAVADARREAQISELIYAANSKTTEETQDDEAELDTVQHSDDDQALFAMLNEAVTKEKNPQNETSVNEPETKAIETNFAGDFDPEPEPEQQPEIIRESETEGKVFAGIPPKEFADILVSGFDNILQWAAPMTYKQMAFSKAEMKRLREIQQQAKVKSKKELVFEADDYDLLARMEEFMDYKEKTVPLTDKEKKSLRIPLEIMLKEKGGDIPPGWAMAYAVTMIALPRFSPHAGIMLAKQFSKFQSPLNNESNESESDGDGV